MKHGSISSIIDDLNRHTGFAQQQWEDASHGECDDESNVNDYPASPILTSNGGRQQNFVSPRIPDREGYNLPGPREPEGYENRPLLYEVSHPAVSEPQTLVQGIQIISTRRLPDRCRSIFPFPNFNAVQSRCFHHAYGTDENLVLSSPTGSGKTAILELAICRLLRTQRIGEYKIVYQGLTKSLCSERQRDWEKKFTPLGLKVTEFTGDTDHAQLSQVRDAGIIITTPEKWDSMTRKWTDHEKLMKLVKLFLIDEVHMLRDERGATLEAVVSRMKSMGSAVRFIALSATIPNAEDVATWLGSCTQSLNRPAVMERFGQEFRPVRLEKHVVGIKSNASNNFAFDKTLDSRLIDIISKHSQQKPIMVFCSTRRNTESTAKMLANWWTTARDNTRVWKGYSSPPQFVERGLKDCLPAGVAYHHAGLDARDRAFIENGYLSGDLSVICCTSTLAVGINLPCHLVIIKGTMSYQGGAMKEMSELDVLQMLGRAGRPQFDNNAVAVIMTRQEDTSRWKQLASGEEILESCLHRNLIEHLNSEIVLGHVHSLQKAINWLKGTFLFVRLQENPKHYQLTNSTNYKNLDELVNDICDSNIKLLQDYGLVTTTEPLRATAYGNAVAQYYVQIETARIFLDLPYKAKISEILSAICQAQEFKEIRFRGGEKGPYRELNKSNLIRFPIPGLVDITGHKISLIIQAALGGVDLPVPNEGPQIHVQFHMEQSNVMQTVKRLIRCLIDFANQRHDSEWARNGLMICRSVAAMGWDDGAMQLRQVEGIGIAYARKLFAVGIGSVEALEAAPPYKIESTLKKGPPFGRKVHDILESFPKLRVSISQEGRLSFDPGKGAKLKIKVEVAFMNDTPPLYFARKPIYVVLLAETSDGCTIFFMRMSARKLGRGQDFKFPVHITSPTQSINCYVMCDEIAGSMRQAMFSPTIPSAAWPKLSLENVSKDQEVRSKQTRLTDKFVVGPVAKSRQITRASSEDEYGLNTLDDSEILQVAEDTVYDAQDEIEEPFTTTKPSTMQYSKPALNKHVPPPSQNTVAVPEKLPNGKYKCKHFCKDKTRCKHFCCREGLDHPPKDSRKIQRGYDQAQSDMTIRPVTHHSTQLNYPELGSPTGVPQTGSYAELDLSNTTSRKESTKEPPALRALHALHKNAQTQQILSHQNRPTEAPILSNCSTSSLHKDTRARNSRPNITSQQIVTHFEGDGFKEFNDYSDPPNLSDLENGNMPDANIQAHVDRNPEGIASDDTTSHADTFDQAPEADFSDLVGWDDDFVQIPEAEKTPILANQKEQSEVSKEHISKHVTTAPRFKKRPFIEMDSSPLFLQSSSDNNVQPNQPLLKRTKLTEADVLANRRHRAHAHGLGPDGLSAMLTDKTEKGAKNKYKSEAVNAATSDDEDIAFLLQEFGTCVEFV